MCVCVCVCVCMYKSGISCCNCIFIGYGVFIIVIIYIYIYIYNQKCFSVLQRITQTLESKNSLCIGCYGDMCCILTFLPLTFVVSVRGQEKSVFRMKSSCQIYLT